MLVGQDLMSRTFSFPVWNHPAVSQETLKDWHYPIKLALDGLGHRIVDEEGPADFTVYTEYFNREDVARILNGPQPFGILCTEWIDGRDLVGRKPHRCKAFLELVPKAAFLWAAVDVEAYRALGRPTAHVEIAWEPDYYRRAEEEPTFDLCYFGSPTPERRKVIEEIRGAGASILEVAFGARQEDRDFAIAQARYVLSMPAKTGKISSTRTSAAMHADRPTLPPAEAMHMRFARGRWDEERRAQLADYQAKPSLRQILAEAIVLTLGRRGN